MVQPSRFYFHSNQCNQTKGEKRQKKKHKTNHKNKNKLCKYKERKKDNNFVRMRGRCQACINANDGHTRY